MDGLTSGLLILGAMALVAAAFHWLLRDHFGEQTAHNLRRLGAGSAAQRWTPERGRRLSEIAACIWATLGILLLTGAIISRLT